MTPIHYSNVAASITTETLADLIDDNQSVIVDASIVGTGRTGLTPDNGDVVITLPQAASNDGQHLTISVKPRSNSTNAKVLLTPYTGDKIGNSANANNPGYLDSGSNGCTMSFVSDGGIQWIITSHMP